MTILMTWNVPIRPTQTSDDTLERWANRRREVGQRIRRLRLDRGLSQEALAVGSGFSRNMIIGLESGRKSAAYERLWDIADVLNVTVVDILTSGRGLQGE